MAFDSLVLAAVAQELHGQLPGVKINKIHQPDDSTLILRYHGLNGKGSLLLSCHAQNGRLHLTEQTRENPVQAPLFAMVLRKWLEGARISGIAATEGERVATIWLESRDELGDPLTLRLVIEIMGKHSNILLLSPDGLIIDGMRRYGSSLSRYRQVLPGRAYKPPPPLSKLPLPPDSETLAQALYQEGDSTLQQALARRVAGLSPLLAAEIPLRAGISPEIAVDELGAAELDNLAAALAALRELIDQHAFQPTLLMEAGRPLDFAAVSPLLWREKETRAAVSMNQAVDQFYAAREAEQDFQRQRTRLSKELRRHETRLEKKIALQEGDLSQCEAADCYKLQGDLLAANLFNLQKGMSEALLPSFEQPDQVISVPLDPALSPQENVQRYYYRYAKAKKARVRIEEQLAANRAELDYLQSIQLALSACASSSELPELEREGVKAGYLRPAPPSSRAKAKTRPAASPEALPPRRYTSVDGFTVLIGRNNRQNDRLSLRQAAEHDIWLHTQKIPGSHVIIISQGQEVPETTLRQAAAWAAWFSRAQDSNQVPVDYLPAGRLRKPAGSVPGFVTYSGQRTLFVQPQSPESVAE